MRIRDIDEICKDFSIAIDYLTDNNDLFNQIKDYMLYGVGDADILLEVAIELSYTGNTSCALNLVKLYEGELVRLGKHGRPFIAQSARELILRNMCTVETNTSNKSLYVIKMSNDSVKIGIATDVRRRFSQIKSASGMKIEKAVYTDIVPDAHKIENKLHRIFKAQRLNGEYFLVGFSAAVKELKKYVGDEHIHTCEIP